MAEPEPRTQSAVPVHQAPPANNLPIQPRPDTVRQTQEPRQGYYRDERPQNGDHNQQWRHTGPMTPLAGPPDGHGNGWGPGPQYRPGHVIDRFPDRNTACLTVVRIISTPAATGIARKARAMSWWRRRAASASLPAGLRA
jgi:hypothetical protein